MSTLKKVNRELEKLKAEVIGNETGIKELQQRNEALQKLIEAYEDQKKLLIGLGESE